MANVYKGLTVQFGGDTSDLQKALKQATSAASDTQSQLKKLNNDLKFDDDNVAALQQKFGLLEDAIGDAAVKLQLYNTTAEQLGDTVVTIKGVTTTVEQLAEETENVGLATSEALAAYNNIDAALENVNVQLSKMEQELIDAGEASSSTYVAVNKMTTVQFDTLISDLVKAGDLTKENAQAIYDLKTQYQTLANENDVYKMVDQFENLQVSAIDSTTQIEKLRTELVNMDVDSISDLSNDFDETARSISKSAQAIDEADTIADDYQSAIQQLDVKMQSHGTTIDDLTLKYGLLSDESVALRVKQGELESTLGIDEDVIDSVLMAVTSLEELRAATESGTVSAQQLQDEFGLTADEAEGLAEKLSTMTWEELGAGASSAEELALKLGLVDDEMENSVATYVATTKKTELLHQEMEEASQAYAQAKSHVDQLTNELETEERALDSLNSALAITEAKISSGVFDESAGESYETLADEVEDLTQEIFDQNDAIAETKVKLADAQAAAEDAEAVFNDTKVAESIGNVRDEVLGIDSDLEGLYDTSQMTADQIIAMLEKEEQEWKSCTESVNAHAEQLDTLQSNYQKTKSAVDDLESAVDDDLISGMERLESIAAKAEQAIEDAFNAEYPRDFAMELDDVGAAAQSIQSELSKVDAALKLDPSNIELAATKMELLEEDIRATRTQADATEAVMDSMGNAVAALAAQTSDAATDAASAKSRYNELTSQLEAMCDPITEATRLAEDLGDNFDLFAVMGTDATEEVISGLTEMGYITEGQADKLREVSSEWSAAKEEMDATEQVQQYKQLSTQLQTLEAHASDAADQLAQMKLDEQLKSNVSDTSDKVKVLDAQLEETSNSLTKVNKKFEFDSDNVQTANERIKLLNQYAAKASEKMDTLKKRMAEIESSGIEKSEKSLYELTKEAEDASDNFKTCAKRVQELEDALADAERRAEELSEASGGMGDEYEDAKRQVDEYKAALDDAKQAQDEAADALTNANLAKEYKELNNQLDDTQAALEDVKEEAQKTSEKVSGVKETGTTSFSSIMYAIEDAGQALEQFGSTLGSAFESAVESAGEVSEAFTNMKKTTEGTEEEFDELLESAKEMSTTSAVSADTILEIEELGGALGIAADDLDDFAETISNLSISTDLEADEAAEEVGSLINILDDLDTSNLEEFSDALVRLGNNGASTEEDIVDIAQRIAAVGSQAGMSTPEILAWASTIASTGSEAESAGTAISNTMSDIETAVAGGGEELELFAEIAGMSADEFATAWEEDPSTAMQNFIEGLASMEDSGESSITALEELGITSVRQVTNIENLASSIGLLDDNLTMSEDAWNGVSDEWGDAGDAANEAEQASEGLSGTLTILENSVQVLGEEVGEALEPLLEDLVVIIQDVTEAVANSDGEFVQFLAQFTVFSTVGGGAIEIASSLANGVDKLSTIFKSTKKSTKTLTTTFSKFSGTAEDATSTTETLVSTFSDAATGATSLSSILKKGLVAVGIAAVIVAVEEVVEWFESFTEVQDEVAEMSEDLDDAEQELADSLDVTSDAAELVSDSFGDVTEYMDDLIDRTEDLADSIDDNYTEMYDGIGDISEATDVLTDFATKQGDFADSTDISASAMDDLETAVEIFNTALGTSYSVMEGADGSFAIVDEAADTTEGEIHDVTEEILGLADEAMWETVLSTIESNMDEISDTINDNSMDIAEIEVEIDYREDAIDNMFDEYITSAEEAGKEDAAAWYESWYSEIINSGYDSDVITEFSAIVGSEGTAYPWEDEDIENLKTYSDEIHALSDEQDELAESTDLLVEENEDLQRVYDDIDAGNVSDQMYELMDAAGSSFSTIVTLAEESVEGGTDILAQGLDEAGVSMDDFMALSSMDLTNLLSEWDGTTANLNELLVEYGLTGATEGYTATSSIIDSMTEGLASGEIDVDTEMQIIKAMISGDWQTVKGIMLSNGVDIDQELINGIISGETEVDSTAQNLILGVIASMSEEDLEALAEELGFSIPDGMIEGIADGDDPSEWIGPLCENLIAAGYTGLDAGSPSQEFVTLGESIPWGISDGITGSTYGDTAVENVKTLTQAIEDTATAELSDFGTTVTSTINESGLQNLSSTMETTGTEAGTALANGIGGTSTIVGTAVTNLINSATNSIGDTFSTKLQNKGSTGAQAFVSAISNKADAASTAGANLGKAVWNSGLSNFETKMGNAAKEGVSAFIEGLESKEDKAKTAGETLGKKVWNGGLGSDFRDDMETAGKKGAQEFVNGVKNTAKLSAAKSAGTTLANKAVAGVETGYDGAYDAGWDFATGYGEGISDRSGWVYNKAYAMAEEAVQAANDAQDSASPSKVMKRVGQWFGEGYAEGIESEYDTIEKVAGQAAALAVDAASTDAVASINYDTVAQASTTEAVLEAIKSIKSSKGPESSGTVVNQTFQTKVVRADSDLYTAAPVIYRNAMREAARV